MSQRTNTEIKKISLDSELVAKVDSLLHSKLEDKVPYGAWQAYVTRLINEDFRRREVGAEVMEEIAEDIESVRRHRPDSPGLIALMREFALRRASDYLARQLNIEDQLLYQHIEDFLGGKLQ